jgi:hypothetical protein
MFFRSNETALRNHLKHNLPANFWYTSSNNGIVQVAHARFVEVKINETRRSLHPGHITKYFSVWPDPGTGRVLHFTDRTEVRQIQDRYLDGVVGSLDELRQFCDIFVVLEGPNLFVPSPQRLRESLMNTKSEALLGFGQVVRHARTVVANSEHNYR